MNRVVVSGAVANKYQSGGSGVDAPELGAEFSVAQNI